MEPLQLKLDHPELDDSLSKAYLRVEQYLDSLRIHNKRILSELTHAIVDEVRGHILNGDAREAVEIAMDAIDAHVVSWHGELTGLKEKSSHTDSIRLSIFRAELASRWSRFFLRSEEIPEKVKVQMRERTLRASPESEPGESMEPEGLDLGKIGKWAEDTWRLFGKLPVLGALAAGLAYFAVLAFVVYFASL